MSLFLDVKVLLGVAHEEITKQKEFWFFEMYVQNEDLKGHMSC